MFKVLHLCDRRQDNHKMPLGFVSHLNRDFPHFPVAWFSYISSLIPLFFRRVKCAGAKNGIQESLTNKN